MRTVLIQGEEKRKAPHQMGCNHAHEHAALVMRLAHQADVAEAEVPQPAVDELRRGTRRRAREVGLVHERDRHAVRRRSFGDARADDAAANHEQVELARGELLEAGQPVVHSGFVHARLPAASATSSRTYEARVGFSSRQAVMSPSASRSRILDAFGYPSRPAFARAPRCLLETSVTLTDGEHRTTMLSPSSSTL